MPKATPTPFDETDAALDAVVASMRKLRQRMFAAYVRQQPLDLQLLHGLSMAIDGTTAALPEPMKGEAEAYAFAEEQIALMLDDSETGDLMDAVSGGLHDPSKDTKADETEFVEAEFERDCRAGDYAAYLARGCTLDREGNPKPM